MWHNALERYASAVDRRGDREYTQHSMKPPMKLPAPPPIPKLYTLREAAQLLNMSYAFVRRQVATGGFHGVRFGRRWQLTADELHRVIDMGHQLGAIKAGRVPRAE